MTRILIAGLKEPPGGVENAVLAYTENFDNSEIVTDFAFICGKISFANRIKNGNIIYLPNRVRHPFMYRKKLKMIFKSNQYDALWCNYSGLTNIDFLKMAKKHGIPKRIIHAHTAKHSWGNIVMKYLVPFFHNKNQKVVDKYATDYWACSQKAADFMFGNKLSQKAVIIPNAIDTDKFHPYESIEEEVRKEFGIDKNTFVIGHVGRMCIEKNQFFLLDVFKEVQKKRPDSVLLFIGDGKLRDSILSYAKELKFEKNVIFTLARTDISRLLNAVDVFVLPSLTEGFPVSLIEAQASDVPSVTSEEAVAKEINMTNSINFVSLEKSAEEWADVIIETENIKFTGGKEIIKQKGYDCKTEAKKLQDFFKKGE